MSWCALDVQSPLGSRDAVAAWLVGRTGQAVEEREDGVLIGFAARDAAAELLTELRNQFGSVVMGAARALPDEDWSVTWRKGLGPRRIGRLVVTPSWAVPPESNALVVVIDPETAFGTGEHASTRTALALLDRWVKAGDRVLDLGSGSGILAIAALRLGASRAVGVDLDPEAEPVARANALHNGVAERAAFITGDAGVLAPLIGPAELVVSNILRSRNEALLPVVRAALAPGGTVIFAGMEQGEAEGFRESLRREAFVVVDQASDDNWWGVASRGR